MGTFRRIIVCVYVISQEEEDYTTTARCQKERGRFWRAQEDFGFEFFNSYLTESVQ